MELLAEIVSWKRTKKKKKKKKNEGGARTRWHESERKGDKKLVEGNCLGYSGT